jgi:hypothetical protein
LSSNQLSQRTVTFYFIAAANSQQVTFTLNYMDNLNNSQSTSATATFNIAGPTSGTVSTPLGQWQINSNSSGFELDFGFPIPPDQGIQFNAPHATAPTGYTGTFEWAQLVTSDQITFTAGSSTSTCTSGTGLDNVFPYGTGLSVADSPPVGLPSADSKVTRSDSFTMYFMWSPGPSPYIPVPLGYVSWQIFGDAVQSNGTWTVQSDSTKSVNAFVASALYPTWTSKVVNGAGQTCH